ncbi:MAG: hypothetical protein HQM16_12765 [Deltaproteobacteria bacterium]|nr:hypothetical protein [Deltaproteobacteria bacterium]
MHAFIPSTIYLDPEVQEDPVTKRILKKFPGVPVCLVSDKKQIKSPAALTNAKKQLYLTKFKGTAIKDCQGRGGDYICCHYYTVSLISDCHLECTYCILQDYLKNNPVITIFTNLQEILSEISKKAIENPDAILRYGPGELSDSLALDPITEFGKDLIRHANQHKNIILELKTKTHNIDHIINEDHAGNTVIAWSINPQNYIEKEEFKCSSLNERFTAARQCLDKKFPIAFHLDPLLYCDAWKDEYTKLIKEVASLFPSQAIAWISMGSLRFTPLLKKIVTDRFPSSKIMTAEIYPNQDGKMRYFRPIREEMYKHLISLFKKYLPDTPYYLCMETRAVWKNVMGFVPKDTHEVERLLTKNCRR